MSEVETATVVWHEPALFDAPPTHMRVPLAVRASLSTATSGTTPSCYRSVWVPIEATPTLIDAAVNGDMEWLDDWLTGAVEEWCAGTIVLDDEVRRIARVLTHPRMMPIPGVTR